MSTRTPRPIRIDVIRKWFEGKSRDQIAREVGVSAGSVSSILKECRQNDPEFDLIREVAVKLRNQGYSVESFAPLLRIREILRKMEGAPLDRTEGGPGEKEEGDKEHEQQQQKVAQKIEEKMESLIIALEVFCLKQNLSIKDFVNQISHLCSVAGRFGIPLEKLPSHIENLENKVNSVEEEIEGVNLKSKMF